MENFLHPYVERQPHTSTDQLELVEFAANNAIHSATEYSPFFLQSGQDPIVSTALVVKGASNSNVEALQEMVDRKKEALEEAKSHLAAANIRMNRLENKLRQGETFKEGD